MKAISVLGTSSNSGKSWFATALCALLRRKGIKVAPFKAQNMSNNSFVTLDGGEMGRAQAVQAEACGLQPVVEMNPILLKPSGALGSQLVILGRAQGHVQAADYYLQTEELWAVVQATLADWKSRCDVLVLEGAGSPVELNLRHRDIVNLRPIQELDGRWVLLSDIERGGVFAQIVGTWNLLPAPDQARGMGVVVNKFRGDLNLFFDAEKFLAPHLKLPYLGVLPYHHELQPESEDSLCEEAEQGGTGEKLAWIRFPHLSNSQDAQPWRMDAGVKVEWVNSVNGLAGAKAIVLPGTKNTLADLAWLREVGLDVALTEAASRGIPIVGLCGGWQMLGESLSDETGVAGNRGTIRGLGLLPVQTIFREDKQVSQVEAQWGSATWKCYEIHMGRTEITGDCSPLLQIRESSGARPEGCVKKKVWGTYLHGVFESSSMRKRLMELAGSSSYQPSTANWREHQVRIYEGMADLIEEHLNLEELLSYVAS